MLGIVGLPVPDETLLAFAGYLAYRGDLRIVPTFAAAFLGSVSGISISYLLRPRYRYRLVHRFGRFVHLTQDHLDRVHAWFARLGRWTLPIGYFIPGVRHLTAYVAGASSLEYQIFAGFAYPGAFIWVGTFVILGYYLAEEWRGIQGCVHRSGLLLLSLAVAAMAGCLVFVWLRRRRAVPAHRDSAPRP
jgi:membrane protein DedA with SNARE-associated domain